MYELKMIVQEIETDDPKQTALMFSIALASEKGVGNIIQSNGPGDWLVLADDGKAVRFLTPCTSCGVAA